MFHVLLVKHDFAQLSFTESSDEVIGCSGVVRHSDGNVAYGIKSKINCLQAKTSVLVSVLYSILM